VFMRSLYSYVYLSVKHFATRHALRATKAKPDP
jgi:hypothetical protein